ncbi:VOC family protein [Streptomyces sp. 549]|uniref:VOC family protein n=1 Tax=Streptomyces sp. 549 TaxID=3049076 RepID=UPI0024C2841C|nr:VOC family protein [Streptomyces sp. 549]MDK1474585.1 VOC family protein [Streptomyces sp. 549]
MTGEPAFFELGVADPARGRTFYEGLFGWHFEAGPSGGEGFLIRTPTLPGGIHGGDQGGGPYLFFGVDDMPTALDRVRELGGTTEEDLERDPEVIAAFGHFVLCRDDQGSPFGLHQPPAR